MPRRIMTEFQLGEISAVDSPAQEGALVTIIKRDQDTLGAIVNAAKTLLAMKQDRTQDRPAESGQHRTGGGSHTAASAHRLLNHQEDDMEPNDFEEAVARTKKQLSVSPMVAMQKARRRWPSLFAKYQQEGLDRVAKAQADAQPKPTPPAIVAFEKKVDDVQARHACSRVEALRKAARQYPCELEAYRSAQA